MSLHVTWLMSFEASMDDWVWLFLVKAYVSYMSEVRK